MSVDIYERYRQEAGGISQIIGLAKVVGVPEGNKLVPLNGERYGLEHFHLRKDGSVGVSHFNYGCSLDNLAGYLEGAVSALGFNDVTLEIRGWIAEENRSCKGIQIARMDPCTLKKLLDEAGLTSKQESRELKVQF